METANIDANRIYSPADLEWVPLVECSLSQFLLDDFEDDLVTGLGLVAFRELGITTDDLHRVKKKLATTQGRRSRSNHGSNEVPLKIRLFCEKKAIRKRNIVSRSAPAHATQILEREELFLDSDTKAFGCWGYFLVERSETSSSCSAFNQQDCIEVYLYREGQ